MIDKQQLAHDLHTLLALQKSVSRVLEDEAESLLYATDPLDVSELVNISAAAQAVKSGQFRVALGWLKE